MGYLLVTPDVLDAKDIKYYERIPDGRGIVDCTMIRVIGSVENVQIVGSKKELDKLILEQKESGMFDKPTILPELGGELVTDETTVDKGFTINPDAGSTDKGVEDAVIVEDTNTVEKEVSNVE